MVEVAIVSNHSCLVGHAGIRYLETVAGDTPCALRVEIFVVGLGIDALGLEELVRQNGQEALVVIKRHQRVNAVQLAADALLVVGAAGAVLVPQSGIQRLLVSAGTVALVGTEVDQFVPVVGVVHQVIAYCLLQFSRVLAEHIVHRGIALLLQIRLPGRVVRSHDGQDALSRHNRFVARQLHCLQH